MGDYLEAHLDCLSGVVNVEIYGERINNEKASIYIGKNTQVENYDRFEGVVDTTAPKETIPAAQINPMLLKALASGSGTFNSE